MRHRVDKRGIAVLEAAARAGQQMRCARHGFHPARHDDIELPCPDELRGQRDRVEARQADLVDAQGRHRHRDPGPHRGLPWRDLPLARLQHLAHDHVVDLVAGDAGPLKRGPDGDAAELRAAKPAQRAEQPSNWRSGPAHDYRFSHTWNDTGQETDRLKGRSRAHSN
jgi:hypothetical protein